MSLPAGSIHPDFESAPAHQQYRANVERLWPDLNIAARAGGKSWSKVVLPSGLHIALRFLPTGARQVVIGRGKGSHDANEWDAEVLTCRRRFGADNWRREISETRDGGPCVTLTETIIEGDFFQEDDAHA